MLSDFVVFLSSHIHHTNLYIMNMFDKVVSALNSKLRREIIKLLNESSLTVTEIFKEINKKNEYHVKYRESIYRAVEKLVDAGLVTKYYDTEKKAICYRLAVKTIKLNLIEDRVETMSQTHQ